MSRSDKNQPWEIRQDDPTLRGYVEHNHLEIIWGFANGRGVKIGYILHECDYNPRANKENFKSEGRPNRCIRRVPYYCYEKTRKVSRKLTQRSSRAKLRLEMQQCKRDGIDASTDFLTHQNRRNRYVA